MCNKHGKRLLTAFLTISLCVLPVTAAAQEDLIDDQQQIQQEVVYRTDVVHIGTLTKETTFSATEYYPCGVDVVCPEDGKLFVEYAVSRGDQVKAGDAIGIFQRDHSVAAGFFVGVGASVFQKTERIVAAAGNGGGACDIFGAIFVSADHQCSARKERDGEKQRGEFFQHECLRLDVFLHCSRCAALCQSNSLRLTLA